MVSGERVRRERKARGMRQKDLAKAVGISVTTMNNLERGRYADASWQMMVRIADHLDVSLDYLGGLVDEPYAVHLYS